MQSNNSSNNRDHYANRGIPNPRINRTVLENQSLEKRSASIFQDDRSPANESNNYVSPPNFSSQTRNNTYQFSRNDTPSNNRLIGLQQYRNQVKTPSRGNRQFSFQQQLNHNSKLPLDRPIGAVRSPAFSESNNNNKYNKSPLSYRQFSYQQGQDNRRLPNGQFGAVHSPTCNEDKDEMCRISKNILYKDKCNESNRGMTNQNNDQYQNKYGVQSERRNTSFTGQNEYHIATSQSTFAPRSNDSGVGVSASSKTRGNENPRASPTVFAPKTNVRTSEKNERSIVTQDAPTNTPSRYWKNDSVSNANDVGSNNKAANSYNSEKSSSVRSDVIKKRKFEENITKSEPRCGTANAYLNTFKKARVGEDTVTPNTRVEANSRLSLNDATTSKRKISFRNSEEKMNVDEKPVMKKPKFEQNTNKNEPRSGMANAYLNMFQKPRLSEENVVGNRTQCGSRDKRQIDNEANQFSKSSAHKKALVENEVSSRKWILVLDTNVLLENLMEIVRIVKSTYENRGKPTMAICATVLRELDKLKTSDHKSLAERSQAAISYINEEIRKEVGVIGETTEEEEKYWNSRDNNDDRILNYCLRLRSDPKYIVSLLTDDKNLANKAAINHVETTTVSQFHQKFVLSIYMEMKAYYESEKNRPNDLALLNRIRSEESSCDRSSALVERVVSSLEHLIIDFFNGVFQAYGRVKKWKEKYIRNIEEVVWMVQFTNTELCGVVPFSDTLFDVLRKFFDICRRKKFYTAYVVKEVLDRIGILVTSLKEELCEGRAIFLQKISELKSQLQSEGFCADGKKWM